MTDEITHKTHKTLLVISIVMTLAGVCLTMKINTVTQDIDRQITELNNKVLELENTTAKINDCFTMETVFVINGEEYPACLEATPLKDGETRTVKLGDDKLEVNNTAVLVGDVDGGYSSKIGLCKDFEVTRPKRNCAHKLL